MLPRGRKPKVVKRGAFDFETWDWVNPRACGFVWGPRENRKREIFIDESSTNPKVIAKQALWHMARLPDETTEWWGHNAGKFDSLFLLEAVAELRWKVRAHIAGGRVITLKVQGPHGEFKIHDSFAVVQSTLKKAAESFKLSSAKLFNDDDYKIDVRLWSLERLKTGCLADCECVAELLDVVESMFENEGGKLKATFSSSALTVVAHHAPILDMRKLRHVNIIARQAFNGGRVEVYRHTPQDPLTSWDINSSFPHSMSQYLPYRYITTAYGANVKDHYERLNSTGIVEATVNVSDTYLPVLPWRHPDYGGVYFPTGKWRGFFNSSELRYAQEHGTRIESLHSMQVYTAEQPFGEFITSFYDHKSKATGAAREFYKLCLNGCYGKFAQKPETEELIIFENQEEAIDEAFKPDYANNNRFRFISASDCRYVAIATERWSKQTHYALAGAITAYSRIALHEYLSNALRPVYTDTDSIHASSASKLSEYVSLSLGGLKVEMEDYNGVFAAPKIYGLSANRPNTTGEYKKVFKSKGFPVSEENFHKILNGESIEKHRIQLAKRQLAGDNQVRRKLEGRSWKGLSSKRRPIYDVEGDTVPWTVEELLTDKHLEAVSPLAKWLSTK